MVTDGFYPGNIYYGQGILVLTNKERIELVPNLHNLTKLQR
jgi:hypothetical protein